MRWQHLSLELTLRATNVLKFLPTELSKTSRGFLEQRFQKEDYESLWCSISALLEALADDWISGVEVESETIDWNHLKLSDIPKEWWKKMAFPSKVEKAMKTFWKKNPSGEIEWSW